MLANGTIVRTDNRPLSTVLCNRMGYVVKRYVPPGRLPDLNEYLVHFYANAGKPEEEYYICRKFLIRDGD